MANPIPVQPPPLASAVPAAGATQAMQIQGRVPRVYLVSEIRLFREGLSRSLAQAGGLEVVGCGHGPEALAELALVRPDLLLLDVRGEGSLELPRAVLLLLPHVRVVAFAVADDPAAIVACARAGICGYVSRNGSLEELVAAARQAICGEIVCPPRVTAELFRQLALQGERRPRERSPIALTSREQEISELAGRGLSNKEIARLLQLSGATVKNHIHSILQKLEIQRRSQLRARGERTPARDC